ncbi:MurR/RpiR family transcriptional regulator [Mitsuokella sp. oral taxon 131]|uniref:MurR/RpiR family transcriptional regulator n=1 Tax=Mitsuokella sp. oral taxon 131 TaxID=1321780 RepID=UPI0003ADA548|nr:MurR/RpiR family transcriptional regulator [Mitsuokella sp. oral taxon 131]ERL04673.1 transcriptional regulator, RpiR family [Mitsuokella sp. oral taxon 131 str. W9106]
MPNTLFLQVIRERFDNLTKSEKKIADYVLENYMRVVDYNIAELSEYTQTSDASIIRFCRTFGCKGYQDFKMRLAREVVPTYKQYNPNLEEGDTVDTICHKVFSASISALQETQQMLNGESLLLAAQRLYEAERIVIACSGNSLVVGEDLRIKMLKIGIRCSLDKDYDLQLMSVSSLTERDVVICISHTGSTKNLYELLRMAKKNHAYLILISTQMKAPIAQLADLVISVCGKETMFHSESTSARMAEMAVIDSIMAVVAKNHLDDYSDLLNKSRLATAKNKF